MALMGTVATEALFGMARTMETTSAMVSGWVASSRFRPPVFGIISVFTGPGATAVTRMPSSYNNDRAAELNLMAANFDMA